MMKNILHIDCSQDEGLVMISNDDHECMAQKIIPAKTIAAQLNVAIDNIINDANIAFADIAAISLVNGPGSYTGLRIGLTTAKAFCFALDIPLILHNRLILLSEQYIDEHHTSSIIVINARKDEFFIAKSGTIAPTHIYLSDLENLLHPKRQASHTMSDTELTFDDYTIEKSDIILDKDVWIENAWEAFGNQDFSSLENAEPFYLKSAFISTPKNNILHPNSK